jgi:radical SAM protein with 4Fe4S-binding SPASM domain
MQINTTVTNNNLDQIEAIYQLALKLGAVAFHPFMLVPVGCGLTIQNEQMVNPAEYEQVLNWVYDRALEGKMELKATCAPHYFRVVRQRRAEARRAGLPVPEIPTHGGGRHGDGVMRGCLAGSGVCFLSHLGEVYPCGYLPVSAGNIRRQRFRDIWENATIFQELRDVESLEGKCGVCEFKRLCLGCRARAYGVSHNYLAEEPFCSYQPGEREGQDHLLPVLDSALVH